MTPKTIFGFTYKNNNVSKSAHISNVFKKSLDMLKFQRIKGLDLKSIPAYLSHRLMGQIQPPMVVGRPQAEDIKTQPLSLQGVKNTRLPPMEDSENINHLGEISLFVDSNKTIKLERITPLIDSDKIINLAPYPLMDRASPQIEEKVYPPLEVGNMVRPQTEVGAFTSMAEKLLTPLGEMSNHKTIAKLCSSYYPNRALSKILKLVLTDYNLQGVQSVRAFFVRYISMRLHIYVELWRDTFECAGNLVDLSVNPLQLRTNQMTVISEAPKLQGVHNCA